MGRVFWRSRRGLLELDLILVPFIEQHYFKLTEKHQKLYKYILEYDDVVLLDWLHDRSTVPTEFRGLIAMIQEHMRTGTMQTN